MKLRLPFAVMLGLIAPTGCDQRCEFESVPIASDEPLGEDNPLDIDTILQMHDATPFEVEVHWDQERGFGSTAAASGFVLEPPRGSATLHLAFDGLVEGSGARFDSTCGKPRLWFESPATIRLGDGETILDPAGNVSSAGLGLVSLSAGLEPADLAPALEVRGPDGLRKVEVEAWARLRDDGVVAVGGLTVLGWEDDGDDDFDVRFWLASSDQRSVFR